MIKIKLVKSFKIKKVLEKLAGEKGCVLERIEEDFFMEDPFPGFV